MAHVCRAAAAALVLLACGAARADVLKVPQQFASIPEAVTAAGPGDEIVVSKGTYDGSFAITAKTDLTLRASGKVVLKPTTALAPTFVFALFVCSNVTVQGFRIVAPDDLDAIRVDSCFDCSIVRCRVKGGNTNVNITGSTAVLLDRSTFADAVNFGISALGTSAIFSECSVRHCGATLVFASNSLCEVRRCTLKSATSGGIQLLGLGTAIVTDNDVSDAGQSGIATDSQSLALVAGNHVRGTQVGIVVPGSGVVISDNRIEGATVAAIDVNADHVVTRGNRIKKCELGLFIHSGGDDGTHEDNSFRKCTGDAIAVKGGATSILLQRNVTRKSGEFGLRDESGGEVTSIANQFDSVGP